MENIVEIFRKTNQGGVGRYLKKVLDAKACTRVDLFKFLTDTIKTDPVNLAQFMDARHTLMFISALDKTVPAKFQHRLRKRIGNPRTFYLATDHYVTLLLTQFVPLVFPVRGLTILPLDFIETQSLHFYREEFNIGSFTPLNIAYDLLVLPSEIVFRISDYLSR